MPSTLGSAPRKTANRPRTRRGVPVVPAAVALALAIAGGVLVWNRIAQVQEGAVSPQVPPGVTRDPATRARGAVVSISGEDSRPRSTYDPAAGTVTVQFQSKYYDPKHTAALNRQYLATEGRLVVQLILYNDPEIGRAVADLYWGRRLLATVSGAPADAYNNYTVEYAKNLP
ncbi:MAG TPA: hypothetical protein VJT32_17445 [bacterium]|nr:hypothetical protein [bacterium]